MGEVCRHCGSDRTKRNGRSRGVQRFWCLGCGRSFGGQGPRFGAHVRHQALVMHLNNVGIRKIALFLGCAPASVINWLRQAHRDLAHRDLAHRERAALTAAPASGSESTPDVIEMDEIYAVVGKKAAGPWFGPPTAAPKSG